MAYTVERLEWVKRLFLKPRQSRGYPKTSDGPRYSLRERSRFSTQTITSTWIDDDNDDNYDPKARYTRKRKRSSRPDDVVPDIPEQQKSLVVVFPIKSDRGRAFLSSLLANHNDHEETTSPEIPSNAVTDGDPKHPVTRVIRTSLEHPVIFNYEPPEDGSTPCHWCDNFTYGLLGLGRRTVEVLDFGDGRYIEIGGGHVAEGHEPSRMCVVCALERVHVMRCVAHRIVPLKGYDVDTFDLTAAYNSLVPKPGQAPKKINPWCSLCPNPAFFGCGALQAVNKFQEPVDASSQDAIGCGLLLCEKCEGLMRLYQGDLAKVVMKNEETDAAFGTRADAMYLLPGNDMYRSYIGS
ncbi:hypothetical protein BDV30DRAFT_55220 [Aspergillus minisclerotigenes]|uniref:C6 finger domain protein n=1 Tax=Aspergillus minisclerotigenes TaxID=656917 RepID=A0A5N6JDF5_9EURO|nr:hypothetical protein BDV30DRAFT_55220 [Aspergillus minisclerotigenes]